MTDFKVDHEMDAQGLYCPEPVMLLHNKVRDMVDGQIVHVIATDPSTQRDIPKFCSFLGHDLVEQQVNGDIFEYYIRKGSD
ncbi:sulfurtransferase TusA [Pontibacterium sp. N1Y112]|uniref:Sulfur carrier protein TusA n=1 Tax=Pontibacterium sinense TaxID=2781979 RepID=A0A8J7FH55_9GAMM|nr:sulfurtransferase TusA [Pontibacterium sinense]MBE9399669.1 sulfurtransferase TusA [Pontibacterium sinense]MCO4756855.1 sulfurtransferase TusA [Oceanospirillaceae bacterium]